MLIAASCYHIDILRSLLPAAMAEERKRTEGIVLLQRLKVVLDKITTARARVVTASKVSWTGRTAVDEVASGQSIRFSNNSSTAQQQ